MLRDAGFQSFTAGGGFAVSTGLASNTENGVVMSRATLAENEAAETLVAWITSREVPASCLLIQPVEPELRPRLIRRGITPENSGHECT